MLAACDRHLLRMVELLEPKWVIGIGAFAEKQAQKVIGERAKIGKILHPSPASPIANQGWAAAAGRELAALGVCPLRDMLSETGPSVQVPKDRPASKPAARAG